MFAYQQQHALESVEMDGRKYALYDTQFEISDSVRFDLQFRTSNKNGLILWLKDNNNDNAIVIEMDNGIVVTRVVYGQLIYSARSTKSMNLTNNIWHCLNIRICGNQIIMCIDNQSFKRTHSAVGFLRIKGPLYLCGRPDNFQSQLPAIRTKENFTGDIRAFRIDKNYVQWICKSNLRDKFIPKLVHSVI